MAKRMKTVMYVRANGIYSDSRATKELESFLKAGYQVIVVGWDRDGDSEKKCKMLFEKNINQLIFCMYKGKVEGNVGFKNIGKLYQWLKYVSTQFMKYKNEINILHACNLDSILFCYRKCKRFNIRIVYDIYDYYVDNHLSIPSLMRGIIEKMEIDMINKSDVCIICTEERREQIIKANPKKVIVIHNTPDVELLNNPIEYDYFYCGILYQKRLINEIFEGYHENSDIRVGFAGFGPFSNTAIELDANYDNFVYHGQVTYKECLDMESRAICLSAIYEPTIRNHRLCAPNKFYESLALGKPVIVCKGTGIDRIVEDNHIGVVINYDVDEFYSAIRWLKENPILCSEMGVRARKLYEQKYNWTIMEKVLLTSYEELFN